MKTKRYESGGVLRDSSGNPVRSGSGEPVGTRYKDSDTKAAESYDLESVKKPRSIEEQIGRKAESKTEEEPRRKISDYMKSSGPFSNVEAAVKSATSKDTESSGGAGMVIPGPNDKRKTQPESTRKAAPAEKKETPSRMTIAKETMEKGRAGPDEAPKKKETPKFAPVTRTRAGTPVATRKEPTEAEKESGRKFSEEKLKKQKEDFENTPFMRMLRGAGGRSEYYKKKADAERQGYGMKKGGSVSSASKRADGIAQRGKTRGRIC